MKGWEFSEWAWFLTGSEAGGAWQVRTLGGALGLTSETVGFLDC